jgi:hypothetical protein
LAVIVLLLKPEKVLLAIACAAAGIAAGLAYLRFESHEDVRSGYAIAQGVVGVLIGVMSLHQWRKDSIDEHKKNIIADADIDNFQIEAIEGDIARLQRKIDKTNDKNLKKTLTKERDTFRSRLDRLNKRRAERRDSSPEFFLDKNDGDIIGETSASRLLDALADEKAMNLERRKRILETENEFDE